MSIALFSRKLGIGRTLKAALWRWQLLVKSGCSAEDGGELVQFNDRGRIAEQLQWSGCLSCLAAGRPCGLHKGSFPDSPAAASQPVAMGPVHQAGPVPLSPTSTLHSEWMDSLITGMNEPASLPSSLAPFSSEQPHQNSASPVLLGFCRPQRTRDQLPYFTRLHLAPNPNIPNIPHDTRHPHLDTPAHTTKPYNICAVADPPHFSQQRDGNGPSKTHSRYGT
jgi:hypothetical protein